MVFWFYGVLVVQVPREAEKRVFTAPDCQQEIDSDEQAVDGGE